MFIGEYHHNLDSKGRIIIPSKFRDELNTTFLLTKGLDGCLAIYDAEKYQKMIEQIAKLPSTKRDARSYSRTIASTSCECVLDNQGRIQIPSLLAMQASLKKECTIIGAFDHIEIWDKETWTNYFNDASDSFEEVAENLSELMNND